MRAFVQRLKRFTSDDDGAIAVIFGLMAVVFVAFGGMSVDMARTYSASSRAGAALDAAILAAGEARNRLGLSDAEVTDLAQKYFTANIFGAGIRQNEFSNFRLSISNDGKTFDAQVDVSVPMHFAGLVSLDQIDFTSRATATFDQLDLELGLMLDVTGSMDWRPRAGGPRTKLEIMKRAVNDDLIGTLIPNNDNPKIRVALAPYSAAVNMGSYASDVLAPSTPTGDNCVVERENNTDTDAAPSNGYYRTQTQADATINTDTNNPGYDYYRCPNAEILPLTTNKQLLVRTVNGYTAQGRTAGHLGISWAWNLISEDWASVWGASSAPKNYNADDLVKAVVLFTDGAFNASYLGTDEASNQGGTMVGPAVDESYDRASSLCANMKQKNVVVFSIGFDLDRTDPGDRRALDALEQCASLNPDTGGKWFFPSADETELRNAFKKIATSLTNLRLSQ